MKEKIGVFVVGLCLVCGSAIISSLMTARTVKSNVNAQKHDFHAWVHQNLSLTAEQDKQLMPSERRYEEERRHLKEVIRLANQELAQAIYDDKANTPRVQSAVARIHEAMGKLQNATLEHIFEMKEVLTPEQYQALMALIKQSLDAQGGKL